MVQCRTAPARDVSSDWRAYGPGGLFDACGGDDAFGLRMGEMPYDSTGGLTIAVPASRPHVAIAGVDAVIAVARERDQFAFLRWFSGGSVLLDQEMTGWSQSVSRTPPAGARDFTMDVYCSFGAGPANCRFDDENRVVSVPWFLFVLSESDDPTAQATGGSLLGADPGHGTESLSFSADDADSGIHTVAVQLGGTTVGSFDFGSACRFTDWNACPLSQSRTLDIDTTQVPDGDYPLRFVVADAADNVNTVDTGRTITIGISREGQPVTLRAQLAERSKMPEMKFNFHPDIKVPVVRVPPINIPEMDIATNVVVVHTQRSSGMMIENLTPQLGEFFGVKGGNGVLVRSVEKGSRAEQAGLRAGDVIVKINGSGVNDCSDFNRLLHSRTTSKTTVVVMRERREQTLTLSMPEPKKTGALRNETCDLVEESICADLDESTAEVAALVPGITADLRRIQPDLEKLKKQIEEEVKKQKPAMDKLQKQIQKQVQDQVRSKQGEWREDMEELRQDLEQELNKQYLEFHKHNAEI